MTPRGTSALAISDEQARILTAALEGRLTSNEHYRWQIQGEDRPDRREREKLMKRKMLDYAQRPNDRGGWTVDWHKLATTERGRAALASHAWRPQRSQMELPA